MLSDDNADRNGTINTENGLSVGGGRPEPPADPGGVPWGGMGPRAPSKGAPGRAPPSQEAQASGETLVRVANAVFPFPSLPPNRCLTPCRHRQGENIDLGSFAAWGGTKASLV